ncbi:MAG: hypothetical protein C4523_00800 [Myxococcales bacterium]|nr:MAG: hypothetical protein C4523_00800 [Myxococcales bacterium]
MESLTQAFQDALAGSPVYAFALVAVAGVLTSFTPCVLPLFPVAVGTITASARKREFIDGKLVETVTSRARALAMGLVYALGLATMFSLLGLFAALSGKAIFGLLASSPVAYLVMAAIMLALALWIWKGDRLDPNAYVQNWAFRGGESAGPLRRAIRWYATTQGGGAAGTFAFGFLSGILAGPCTAPVIAAVLAYVAQVGAVAYGVALMFVYASGLAAPMVVAGMSATLASRLKKSGRLAKAVKGLFLALLLVAMVYFLHRAAYFAGLLNSAGTTAAPVYAIVDVQKDGPPPVEAFQAGATLPDFSFETWRDPAAKEAAPDAPERRRLADLRGKIVIMPFWGIWCAECVREIPDLVAAAEKLKDRADATILSINVLDDPARVPGFTAAKGIVYPVAIDADGKLVERLGAVSFPLNLILDARGKVIYSGSAFPKDWEARVREAKGKEPRP